MPLMFDQGAFALGAAMGVLSLIFVLSLIISYAYKEPTLLALASYLAFMVFMALVLARAGVGDQLVSQLMLIAGPLLVSGLMVWLLKKRDVTVTARISLAVIVTASLVLGGLHRADGALDAGVSANGSRVAVLASALWFLLVLGFSIYLMVKSWHTAGPWKWWALAGHGAGLAVSALFLTDLIQSGPAQWPPILMLLVQVPPLYVSLVWRSRLLNESRLRSASAEIIDPLTGLATNPVLVERLMRVMSRAHQSSTISALYLIEVKNWQGLLNELGAEFNEKLLLEAALRLRRAIGDNDLAARMSGGRFAIVAQGLASDEDITSLATRLVVTGLRIDSPLLKGVEFHFRVLVSNLKVTAPMTLPATQLWLDNIALQFADWPSSHRSRSILVVTGREAMPPAGMKINSAY